MIRHLGLYRFLTNESIFFKQEDFEHFFLRKCEHFIGKANARSLVELMLGFSFLNLTDGVRALQRCLLEKLYENLKDAFDGRLTIEELSIVLFLCLKANTEFFENLENQRIEDSLLLDKLNEINDFALNFLVKKKILSLWNEDCTIIPIESMIMCSSGVEILKCKNMNCAHLASFIYEELGNIIYSFLIRNTGNSTNFINLIVLYLCVLVDQKIYSHNLWKVFDSIINGSNFIRPSSQIPMLISRMSRRLPMYKENIIFDDETNCNHILVENIKDCYGNEGCMESADKSNTWISSYKCYCINIGLYEKYIKLRSMVKDVKLSNRIQGTSISNCETTISDRQVDEINDLYSAAKYLQNQKIELDGKVKCVKSDYCIAEVALKDCFSAEIYKRIVSSNFSCKSAPILSILLHISKAVIDGFPGEMTDYLVPNDCCKIIIVDAYKKNGDLKCLGQFLLPSITDTNTVTNPLRYVAIDVEEDKKKCKALIGRRLCGSVIRLHRNKDNEVNFAWIKFVDIKRLGYLHVSRILKTTKSEGRALLEKWHKTREVIEVEVAEFESNKINVMVKPKYYDK